MENNPKELREHADYLEWVNDPLIKLTKALHRLYCQNNHTDACSFSYEENSKKVVSTNKNSYTAHSLWYKKALAVHALLNGSLLKLAEKIENYPFECEAGNLKLSIDWQTLKIFLAMQ